MVSRDNFQQHLNCVKDIRNAVIIFLQYTAQKNPQTCDEIIKNTNHVFSKLLFASTLKSIYNTFIDELAYVKQMAELGKLSHLLRS